MVTDEVDLNFCLQTAFGCRLRLTAYNSFVGPGRQTVHQCVHCRENRQRPRRAEGKQPRVIQAEQLQNTVDHGECH